MYKKYFEKVDEDGFRIWLKDGKKKTIDDVVQVMIHLKEHECYDYLRDKDYFYPDYHPALLYGLIEDINGFYNEHELNIVAIEIANILAKDYKIYGSD